MVNSIVWRAGLLVLIAIASGCANKMETREAVQLGVIEGVAKRGVNVEAMDVKVTSVSFHDKVVDAVVAFAPKGGSVNDGLTMKYTLEQQGEHWVIKGRSQMQGNPHGGTIPTARSGEKPLPIPGHDNMGAQP
jgi:hypothetical protein